MLKKVIEFVNNAFEGKDPSHFERTVYWLKVLKPDADEAMQIAAYAHDVGRSVSKDKAEDFKDKEINDSGYLKMHQELCAKAITDFLKKENYPTEKIKRVHNMVLHHEEGGDAESDLIKDADSISYFETNAEKHIEKFAKVIGKEKTKAKYDFMFNRISSDKAKKIAKPMYERVLKLLDERVPE